MKTLIQIDVSDLLKKMDEFSRRVSPATFEKVYRYTFKETGNKVKTIADPLIREKYKAPSRKVKAAFQKPIISTSGRIVCMVPVRDIRGKIGKKGMYAATSAPGAQVLVGKNSLLPTTGERKHFYIGRGRLAGHVFVRHNDGKTWIGTRRESEYESFRDSLNRRRRRLTGKMIEQGNRKRKGTITHAVGIGTPQMPMNRAADDVRSAVLAHAHKRFKHHAERALRGGI